MAAVNNREDILKSAIKVLETSRDTLNNAMLLPDEAEVLLENWAEP